MISPAGPNRLSPPPCKDEKFNLVAELTPTQMGPYKSRNLA